MCELYNLFTDCCNNMVKKIPEIYKMILIHPILNTQVATIIRQLSEQRVLYREAIIQDSYLSVKKGIRVKIRELLHRLDDVYPRQKIV